MLVLGVREVTVTATLILVPETGTSPWMLLTLTFQEPAGGAEVRSHLRVVAVTTGATEHLTPPTEAVMGVATVSNFSPVTDSLLPATDCPEIVPASATYLYPQFILGQSPSIP